MALLSHSLPVFSFPVLAGRVAASCLPPSESRAFSSWLVVMDVPNATGGCQTWLFKC